MIKKIGKLYKRRKFYDVHIAFLILPLLLIPILIELIFHYYQVNFFIKHREEFLFGDILYIVLVRFILLDTALFIFTHTKHPTNATLMHIVLLYLEITIITILYYAIVYYIFDVHKLFHLNSNFPSENLKIIKEHTFVTAFYISTVTFSTLGSGDWIPQTINAMLAVSSEVILGIVQSGIFISIIIYGHQNREIKT